MTRQSLAVALSRQRAAHRDLIRSQRVHLSPAPQRPRVKPIAYGLFLAAPSRERRGS
jgi:hypothetical protein